MNGDDVDVDESDDDDGEVSVGRDVVGQNVGEVYDEDEEEEEETKIDVGGKNKNASSTSAYSSFESNEERGSESS